MRNVNFLSLKISTDKGVILKNLEQNSMIQMKMENIRVPGFQRVCGLRSGDEMVVSAQDVVAEKN